MSKLLSDEMYEQIGIEIDSKLKHMQDIIIELAVERANESKRDIQDLQSSIHNGKVVEKISRKNKS